MAKENIITEENFGMLLSWLDGDSETAAQKYEKIRRRLIRIFIGRGCCFEAETLADETFDRVTRKVPQLVKSYTGEPTFYFYGVADKIHLEWQRRQKKLKQPPAAETDESDQAELEIEYECLETCLEELPADHYRLITAYYRKEKSAMIENRRELAKNLGISLNALHVNAFRIRAQLKDCLLNCVAKKIM